jgi:hypothetical protein
MFVLEGGEYVPTIPLQLVFGEFGEASGTNRDKRPIPQRPVAVAFGECLVYFAGAAGHGTPTVWVVRPVVPDRAVRSMALVKRIVLAAIHVRLLPDTQLATFWTLRLLDFSKFSRNRHFFDGGGGSRTRVLKRRS